MSGRGCARASERTRVLALPLAAWYAAACGFARLMSAIEERGCSVTLPVWTYSAVIVWTQWLLNSYAHWIGRELMDRVGTPDEQAHALFLSPLVVVSHGMEEDPILNYGNQTALDLWEMTWDQLTQIPSRCTAEPSNQEERAWMLRAAHEHGFFDRYRGVRISATGRRFMVEDATVWNVLDGRGKRVGQAATFSRWTLLA